MKVKGRNALQYIIRVSGKTKIHIVTLLLVQIILGMSSVFYALFFRDVIDSAVSHDRGGIIKSILLLVLLTVFIIAMRAVVRFLQEYTNVGFENAFKNRFFSVLLSKDYGSVSEVHSGEWMNRLTSDTAVIAEGLSSILPGIGEMLARMLGAAVMIIVIEPLFGLILIPGGLIFAVLTYIFRRHLKKLHKKVQEADGKVRVFFQEHLESLVIIKSYSAEKKSVRQASEKMTEHKRARIRRNHFSNICNIGFASAMNGAYILGVVYGAFGIYNSTVSYGTLMALLQLIGQIQSPFANITGYLPKYYAMIASAERLMEAERFTDDGGCVCEDMNDDRVSVELSEDNGEIVTENAGTGRNIAYKSEHGKNDVRFTELGLRGAAFSYKNGDKGETAVLDNFDFYIHKGEYVAFTGESGCGKSTVLKLLMSLYPLLAGERYILLDNYDNSARERDKDHVKVNNYSSEYRHLFAYVPQGNYLMSGTIREIVTFGDDVGAYNNDMPGMFPDRKDHAGKSSDNRISPEESNNKYERLTKALEISCAADFIAGLPHGVDTVLGERGAGLSEGQMQRIAIARAVYSDRPVLLLDEATSALDGQTEERLLLNLRAMTDKTVIIVTHRQAALAVCDRRVVFYGTNVS